MLERLQKLIAQAGICSRRKAEELILGGRVTVNGVLTTELGSKADPEHDSIKVDDKRLRFDERRVYYLLNKPKGFLCTAADPEGRPIAIDLIPERGKKLFTVGRLDMQTEGLILVTNDGDFAQLVSHAGRHCPKTYLVKVQGNPEPQEVDRLSKGIVLEGKKLAPCKIQRVKEGENPWYKVILIEGKNNQIRRMFETIGYRVSKLKRVQIGFLSDPHLSSSGYRPLTPAEVERFLKMKTEKMSIANDGEPLSSPVSPVAAKSGSRQGRAKRIAARIPSQKREAVLDGKNRRKPGGRSYQGYKP
jgi:23S rRNA pseudouridine2605 synthase